MGKWTLFKPLLTDVTFSLVEGVSQLTDGVARYSALFEYYSAACFKTFCFRFKLKINFMSNKCC